MRRTSSPRPSPPLEVEEREFVRGPCAGQCQEAPNDVLRSIPQGSLARARQADHAIAALNDVAQVKQTGWLWQVASPRASESRCRVKNPFRFAFVFTISLILLLYPKARAADAAGMTSHLPSSVDLRPTFGKWGLPMRSQGNRGTCSVFTMTGAIEFALASQHQAGTVLSVEYLNWASNQATTNSGDGGFFADLWTGFERYGICAETDLPYRPSFDADLKPDQRVLKQAKKAALAHLRLEWIKPWDVTTGLTDAQFQAIKRTLASGWPVCGGLRWPKHARWKQNVLEMVPPADVFDGHSVLLVGFKDDPARPGGGVLLIRNSGAGPSDGALPYAYVRAYLNDAAWIKPTDGKKP